VFFVEVFLATKVARLAHGRRAAAGIPALVGLGRRARCQIGRERSGYFWVEELDTNNVPSGVPRAYGLPYSRPLADNTSKAPER